MKKLFILIICIFLLTGCYDNIELNNLAIVTGIGLDYQDNEFYITYEILNDIKTGENSSTLSFTASGHGKTIPEAFTSVNYKVGKKPYFAHLKIVLISENIVKDKLDKILDYFLRDTNIRDEFYMIVSKNNPYDILNHNSEHYPVVSDLIINLIKNEKYNNNLSIYEDFQNTLAKMVSKNTDAVLSSISLQNDEISLDNFYVLKGMNFNYELTKNQSTIYNLLTINTFSKEFKKEYDNKTVTIIITDSNTETAINSDEINISLKLKGRIIENNPNLNLKEEETYKKLNHDFEQIIKDDILEFMRIVQENKSDILGLQDLYFKKERKENNNLWTHAKVNVKVNLQINTKGFIFEVTS